MHHSQSCLFVIRNEARHIAQHRNTTVPWYLSTKKEKPIAMNADLEQIFASIEEGNALREKKQYWEAAKAYTEARRQLLTLASNNNDNEEQATAQDATEAAQIRELYQRQARDYLHQARASLVEALTQEDAADQALQLDEPTRHEQFTTTHNNGSNDRNNNEDVNVDEDDTSLERLKLFAWLFANEQSLHVLASEATTTSPVVAQEKQDSLEDRLRALNASLPQSVKTNDERMRDLNKSLRHLGIAVPSASPKQQELFEVGAKSEFEQVEDIISQAKDEARMQQLHPTDQDEITTAAAAATTSTSKVDISDAADKLVDSMLDAAEAAKSLQTENDDKDSAADDPDSSNHDDDDDNAGDGANPFTLDDLTYFQDRVNEAQTSLAELNAMLERDENDTEEDVGLLFDPDTGKHALDSALRYLLQVQKRWKEAKKRGK